MIRQRIYDRYLWWSLISEACPAKLFPIFLASQQSSVLVELHDAFIFLQEGTPPVCCTNDVKMLPLLGHLGRWWSAQPNFNYSEWIFISSTKHAICSKRKFQTRTHGSSWSRLDKASPRDLQISGPLKLHQNYGSIHYKLEPLDPVFFQHYVILLFKKNINKFGNLEKK